MHVVQEHDNLVRTICVCWCVSHTCNVWRILMSGMGGDRPSRLGLYALES